MFFSTIQIVYSQVTINAVVECPPCRPISGCDVCWENQADADLCETLSVDNYNLINQNHMIISPNPVKNGTFNIIYNKKISGKITIVNLLGLIVKTIDVENNNLNKLTVNMNVESGLYFLIYYDTNRKEKIIEKLFFNR